jgi:hypothetical protein
MSLIEFTKRAQEVLESRIKGHLKKTEQVLNDIETHQPQDKVVKAKSLKFAVDEKTHAGIVIQPGDREYESLHPFAMGQVGERSGIPKTFQDTLRTHGAWGYDLLVHNLNQLYSHDPAKYLLRSVGGQVRGFLSDRYRRLDSRPLVEAFMSSIEKVGALPYESHFTDTKLAIKAIMPRVVKLSDTEVLALGVMFGNSDFGNGPLEVSFFAERLVCTNGMVASRDLKKIHLGARLSEDMDWSNRTYQLDSETNASAIKDLVAGRLSAPSMEKFTDVIRKANTDEMKPEAITSFLGKALTKERTRDVVEAFNSADVVNLPAGQTRYRLSQSISWVANAMKNEEEKLEMQRLAGAAIDVSGKLAA